MTPSRTVVAPLLAAALGVLFSARVCAQTGADEDLGTLVFPTSAQRAETQAAFERAVLLLHSFEYEDARLAFQEVQRMESDLAIAYWGEALTHHRPLWRQEDFAAGRAALAKLGKTRAARAGAAGSEVERGLLGAVEVLFGTDAAVEVAEPDRAGRANGYCAAMAELAARHPHNVEIGAFHCLSTLGTAVDGRDERIYMRAAAVGMRYYRIEPRHPGLLHYLIHSYDDPVHAPLGLPMARAYDQVAPGAEHALHMPTHIYHPLGLWQEAVDANRRSVAAADARRERLGKDLNGRGWHAFLWQAYGHLQLGQRDAAREMLVELRDAMRELPSQRIRYHFCHLRAMYAMDLRADGSACWSDPLVALEVDTKGIDDGVFALDQWVRGMVLLERGDTSAVDAVIAELESPGAVPVEIEPAAVAVAEASTSTDEDPAAKCCAPVRSYGPSSRDLASRRVSALLLRAARAMKTDPTAAVIAEHLRAAMAIESDQPLNAGPPYLVTAHEIAGDWFRRTGDADAARAAYGGALERAPGRRPAAAGLRQLGN